MQYVVFGATGYIGSYIFKQLKRDGINVLGTVRNELCFDDQVVIYDILNDTLNQLLLKTTDDDKVAIVCIAESNIDACSVNYYDAYRINVVRTKELIRELSLKGFRVIFFSSDQVFDGKQGNYTEESKRHPLNKYGMMKSEIEDYLLANEPEACILRIPKVVSALRKRQNVFSEWTEKIAAGSSIRCIKGQKLSFISIDDIYKVCRLVAERGLNGLYNIAGDKKYSRAELAHMFCGKLGMSEVEIEECDVEAFHFKEKRPLNLCMSNAKFKAETGYIFESMDSLIDRYIENLRMEERI